MSYKKDLEAAGISYLGNVSQSMKLRLSEEHGVLTYGVYLAPANMSGYEVCPCSRFCREFCLNGSGRNKIERLAGMNRIQSARIRQTRLFFEDRDRFMRILIHEISKARKQAEAKGLGFAVRLNCTSDLNPEEFVYEGRNILEIFNGVQFYDYTKVPKRLSLLNKYPNYDLTFSYDGHNGRICSDFLDKGGKVAVVFGDLHTLPKKFMGHNVHDGNAYDMRYLDPAGVVGLHYHPVAGDYKKWKFTMPNTAFVVGRSDNRAIW